MNIIDLPFSSTIIIDGRYLSLDSFQEIQSYIANQEQQSINLSFMQQAEILDKQNIGLIFSQGTVKVKYLPYVAQRNLPFYTLNTDKRIAHLNDSFSQASVRSQRQIFVRTDVDEKLDFNFDISNIQTLKSSFNSLKHTTLLIDLGSGKDRVNGMLSVAKQKSDLRYQFQISGSGEKEYIGGRNDDEFHQLVSFTAGTIYDGGGGCNTLIYHLYAGENRIRIDLSHEIISLFSNLSKENIASATLRNIQNVKIYNHSGITNVINLTGTNANNEFDIAFDAVYIHALAGDDIIKFVSGVVMGGEGRDTYYIKKNPLPDDKKIIIYDIDESLIKLAHQFNAIEKIILSSIHAIEIHLLHGNSIKTIIKISPDYDLKRDYAYYFPPFSIQTADGVLLKFNHQAFSRDHNEQTILSIKPMFFFNSLQPLLPSSLTGAELIPIDEQREAAELAEIAHQPLLEPRIKPSTKVQQGAEKKSDIVADVAKIGMEREETKAVEMNAVINPEYEKSLQSTRGAVLSKPTDSTETKMISHETQAVVPELMSMIDHQRNSASSITNPTKTSVSMPTPFIQTPT